MMKPDAFKVYINEITKSLAEMEEKRNTEDAEAGKEVVVNLYIEADITNKRGDCLDSRSFPLEFNVANLTSAKVRLHKILEDIEDSCKFYNGEELQ
jgi:hypothetical protein